MAAVPQTFKTGPQTYVPAELVVGGQVVEARASSRVGVAGAGSLKTLGIAVTDGINPEAFTNDATVVNGLPVLDATQRQNHVVVANGGIVVAGVKYAAAAAFGDRLKAAALGTVTPMGAAEDCRLQVGVCVEPAGVLINATGLVRTI
jgi:hypothetical protein